MSPFLAWQKLTPVALSCALVGIAAGARAQEAPLPFLHPLFTDNMVLQRGIQAPIWGWTQPGQKVTVEMNGKTATATANAQGKWVARLGPFTAGGPYEMTVKGPETITLKNVLVGDVWICSGQSNMEMGIGVAANAQEEIKAADYPQLRLYTVPKKIASKPEAVVNSKWDVCTPETIAAGGWGGFSAAGYYFGRQLQQDLKIPIGLIHTSWGGTVAEAWTSAEALKRMPDFKDAVEQFQEMAANQAKGQAAFDEAMAQWWKKNDPGTAAGYEKPDAQMAGAKTMKLPVLWEDAGLPNYDGVVWFRKEVDVPDAWAGKDLVLHLGPIDDRDTTWFNGTQVGAMNEYNVPRDYKVPGNLVKAGKNVIAIRVLDTGGGGGIYGQADQLKLELPGNAEPISLAGDWQYKDTAPLGQTSAVPQNTNNNPNVVTVLYNGMIAPLVPFGIKGAIWYQGESNAGRAMQYRTLLPTMIKDWRARFGVGDFPFFIVQLANFMQTRPEPGDSGWAELREAQALTAQTLPKTGMACIIDIGDAADIHPKDKQDVGKRLALSALAIAYGQKIEYSGPMYKAMQVKDGKAILTFSHVGTGLVVKGDKLQGFAIAGEDKHFVWADATIEGDKVILSSPQVQQPVAVRYAWADNPVCNLYNKEGLPAVPFRTDMPK